MNTENDLIAIRKAALDKAVKESGGQTALANRLSEIMGRTVKAQNVQHWQKHKLPAEWVIRVEQASGVSRHELRPDIYPA